ncbi:MAG: NtrZ family periplasmic regulatory protein [Brevundimonas sp.]
MPVAKTGAAGDEGWLGMRFGGLISGVAAMLVIASAGAAAAQASGATPAPTVRAPLQLNEGRAAPRSLRFNENGRWSLNLNMQQPVGRETEWGDVEAGAYYRVNPRLRLGASAGLGRPETDPARAAESDRRAQPRVRLESIFRF